MIRYPGGASWDARMATEFALALLALPHSGEEALPLLRADVPVEVEITVDSPRVRTQGFYEILWSKKLGRADALRAAQLEMLAKNRAQFHDVLPSTWGAFVLSGEWR